MRAVTLTHGRECSPPRLGSLCTSSGWLTIATWFARDLGRPAARARGELPLGLGRDRPIAVRNEEPGRQRLPGGNAHHLLERRGRKRLLRREHDVRLHRG